MDPRSHDFKSVLDSLGLRSRLFAIKTLKQEGENYSTAAYQNEIDQLKSFNGQKNPHLVMLLATYELDDTYNFVFPYAKCNLREYWNEPSPEAIKFIHYPPHLDKFGMHVDIKPDNVLLYKCDGEPRGVLVLSDLGFTQIHSEISRSRLSPARTPMTPTYRPPESDCEAHAISRACDIWSFGCLMMETIIWLLVRKEEDVTDEYGHVVSVKPEVTKWFNKIRNHEKCTRYIHEVVCLIEDEMIVVRSERKDRCNSKDLFYTLSMINASLVDEDYYTKIVNEPRPDKEPDLVAVQLGKHMTDEVPNDRQLQIHEGPVENRPVGLYPASHLLLLKLLEVRPVVERVWNHTTGQRDLLASAVEGWCTPIALSSTRPWSIRLYKVTGGWLRTAYLETTFAPSK
ncbi:kinase-like domain-containing protein [Microdochium bolleyi]|uniref:Kinase-like domain-containing protein n=1 Tax=Microdochium bolleyi TaxID=196109 RepID=A0A136IJE6_9PEZI|nr:kinase-like domain-containing protein [Microdochium bolleyi]